MKSGLERVPRFVQSSETERRGRFLVAKSAETSSHHTSSSDAVFSLAEQGLIGLSEGVEESFGEGTPMSREAMRLLGKYSREIKGQTVGQLSDRMSSVVERIIEIAGIYSPQNTPKGERPAAAGFIAAKILETQQGTFAIVKSIGSSRAFIWRAGGRVDFLGTEHGLFEDSELQAMVFRNEITQEEHDIIRNSPTLTDFVSNLETGKIGTKEEIDEILGLEKREALEQTKRYLQSSTLVAGEKIQHQLRLFKLFELFKQYPKLREKKTQALGTANSERADIHTVEEKMQPGDRLVLASGIESLLPDEISFILSNSKSLQEGLDVLRQAASERTRDPSNRLSKGEDIVLNGIAISPELAPGIRKPFGPRATPVEAERLRAVQEQESLSEARQIQVISEILAKDLGLADPEQDPEVAELNWKIHEEKRKRDDFKRITDAFGEKQFSLADLKRVPSLAQRYFKALKRSWEVQKMGGGDTLGNWEEQIKKLERDLKLLKLKKEHQEKTV